MEEKTTERYTAAMETLPSQIYLLGALGSIAMSALFFLSGRRSLAYFVGLWAPTILSFALFYKLLRPSREPVGEEMHRAAEKVTKTTGM